MLEKYIPFSWKRAQGAIFYRLACYNKIIMFLEKLLPKLRLPFFMSYGRYIEFLYPVTMQKITSLLIYHMP